MFEYKMNTPCYIIEERLLRRNLGIIRHVADSAGVNIILAFKAFAMWKTFPIIKEYITHSTASSVNEARLAFEEMGTKAHTFSPAYDIDDIDEYISRSSHITFNSLSQVERFRDKIMSNPDIGWGIRVNPEYSPVETDLYNPCKSGSRFGVLAEELGDSLPEGIDGLHFHALCESNSYDLEKLLSNVEKKFGKYFGSIKWINMGGGHLMTHKDYDINHLIDLLKSFSVRYPHIEIILEPGSAFAWQTGNLYSKVIDVVEHGGVRTAILNVSFTCHMPDCLEMPYQPAISGAEKLSDIPLGRGHIYRMGGNSCLSGDWVGDYVFERELKVGDEIVFEDMIHYTTVKTNMFNGIGHPDIAIRKLDGTVEVLREYGYEDYKHRMN